MPVHGRSRFDDRVRSYRLQRLVSDGAIDLGLAGILAGIAIVTGGGLASPAPVLIDLLAAALAAGAVRWPKQATALLIALLLLYIWAPRAWLELGHYAALIVILGAGLRRRRVQRRAMAVGSLVIFTTDQLCGFDAGDSRAFSASLVWLGLITAMWLLGNAFTALGLAQDRARQAALAMRRLALARDMHDTVARSLTHLARGAQTAAADSEDARFGILAEDASTAISQLRLLLAALRDPQVTKPTAATGSLPETLNRVAQDLQTHGYPVSVSVEGDLESVAVEHKEVLGDVLNEITANIQNHGAPNFPCIIAVSVEKGASDIVVINQIEQGNGPGRSAPRLGLVGAGERLVAVGGRILAQAEGDRWITRVTIPAHQQSVW